MEPTPSKKGCSPVASDTNLPWQYSAYVRMRLVRSTMGGLMGSRAHAPGPEQSKRRGSEEMGRERSRGEGMGKGKGRGREKEELGRGVTYRMRDSESFCT